MNPNGSPRIVYQHPDNKIKIYPDGGVAIYLDCEISFLSSEYADVKDPNDYFQDPHPLLKEKSQAFTLNGSIWTLKT